MTTAPLIRDTRFPATQAWTAASLDAPESWYYPLPPEAFAPIQRFLADAGQAQRPVEEYVLPEDLRRELRGHLKPVIDALEEGRGFAVLTGIDPQTYTEQQQKVIYWLVGQALGTPFEQNVQGTLIYDVRDTGYKVEQGARFSVTNAESSFHTDNSFGDTVLDYVGLLALKTARSGGLSQNVSGYTVYNELLERDPEALEILSRPFHVDRRGGVKPGQEPTAQFPVFVVDGQELLVRYLRYWIHEGHDKAGVPLSDEQIRALNLLDELLARPDLRAEFALKPGEIFFINNRWILHNRTAFEAHPEPERRRHLIRLWIRRDR